MRWMYVFTFLSMRWMFEPDPRALHFTQAVVTMLQYLDNLHTREPRKNEDPLEEYHTSVVSSGIDMEYVDVKDSGDWLCVTALSMLMRKAPMWFSQYKEFWRGHIITSIACRKVHGFEPRRIEPGEVTTSFQSSFLINYLHVAVYVHAGYPYTHSVFFCTRRYGVGRPRRLYR